MSPRHTLALLHRMGPAWVLWRIAYAARKRTGWLKRGLSTSPLVETELCDLLQGDLSDHPEAVRENHESRGGRFFFSRGAPPAADCLTRIAGAKAVAQSLATADAAC